MNDKFSNTLLSSFPLTEINFYLFKMGGLLMLDNDCTLHTIGHFAGLTPDQVANITNQMNGAPLREDNIVSMIQQLHLGDGRFEMFDSREAAINYMINSMAEEFAFAWAGQPFGHMVCARRGNRNIECRDYQNGGGIVDPPDNGFYYVWPIFR
jgi:hypothetical protein